MTKTNRSVEKAIKKIEERFEIGKQIITAWSD